MLTSLTLIGFTAAFGLYCHCQWAKTQKKLEAYDFLLRNGWRHALSVGGWIHPLMKDRQWSVYSTQEALEVTAKSTWAMREITEAERNQSATYREEQLREKNKRLINELARKDEALRKKRIQLDAMNWVWCSGGCRGGVRRFVPGEVNEQTVLIAEQNTARLREWWEIAKRKKARRDDEC